MELPLQDGDYLSKDSEIKSANSAEDALTISAKSESLTKGCADSVGINQVTHKQRCKTKASGEKVFVARESVITEMYRIPHINTVYNCFAAMLFYMLLYNAMESYLSNRSINIGLKTIYFGMGGFLKAVGIWCVMQAASILVYFALKLWLDVHECIELGKYYRRLWDKLSLLLYIAFLVFFMVSTSYSVVLFELAFGSSVAILMEMTRFVMKIYAFVRTNVPRMLNQNNQSNAEGIPLDRRITYPSLGQYLYFLFAPTLLYRDEYPRTSKINWRFAFCRLVEFISAIFFIANLYELHIKPHHQDFRKVPTTAKELLTKLYVLVLPTALLVLMLHYILIHVWFNLTGELLRFADRVYYKDWWNSFNYKSFFPSWNIVVQDWLYEYVYKDLYRYVFCGSTQASKLAVFIISIIFHEFIIGLAVRFFVPVFLMFFGVGGMIGIVLTSRMGPGFGGMFFCWSFSLGNVQLFNYYFMEFYARQNCQVDNSSWLSSFKPVSFYCNGLR